MPKHADYMKLYINRLVSGNDCPAAAFALRPSAQLLHCLSGATFRLLYNSIAAHSSIDRYSI